MIGKEKAQQERMSTKNPEIAEQILGETLGRVTGRFIINALDILVFKEKNAKIESPVNNYFKFRSQAETGFELKNEETFINNCRYYEDTIEESEDPERTEQLSKEFAEFKTEWKKQQQREMEDRKLRDKKEALWREKKRI